MKKNTFTKSLIIAFLVILTDYLFKKHFVTMGETPINKGLFLGFFRDTSQGLKVIFLASTSGFLFTIYLFFIYFISSNFYLLKYGLSFFIGGIWGNVIDQVVYGHAFDFIPIPIGKTIYANTADIFQWLGFLIVLFTLFSKKHDIWNIYSIRKTIIVNRPEQMKFSFIITTVSVCTCLILGLFSYSYFKAYFPNTFEKTDALFIYVWSFLFICSSLNILVFVLSLYLSHRTAGPLYAFEKYVEDLLAGKDYELHLREGDNYSHFERLAAKLKREIQK
jgi:signal peptidase II